jgi:hypothetical protein
VRHNVPAMAEGSRAERVAALWRQSVAAAGGDRELAAGLMAERLARRRAEDGLVRAEIADLLERSSREQEPPGWERRLREQGFVRHPFEPRMWVLPASGATPGADQIG